MEPQMQTSTKPKSAVQIAFESLKVGDVVSFRADGGKPHYTVTGAGDFLATLRGAKGAEVALVQNRPNPRMVSAIFNGGRSDWLTHLVVVREG